MPAFDFSTYRHRSLLEIFSYLMNTADIIPYKRDDLLDDLKKEIYFRMIHRQKTRKTKTFKDFLKEEFTKTLRQA